MAFAGLILKYTGEYRLEYPKLHVLFDVNGRPEWFEMSLPNNLSEEEIAEVKMRMDTWSERVMQEVS